MLFSNLLLPYKLNIFLLECEKYEKPQVHFNAPLMQKKLNVIFHLLKQPPLNMQSLFNFFKKLKKMFILMLKLNNIF
jgi:hypothetical protein